MKNKKMETINYPEVVTHKLSTKNPNLACHICGVDVKTTANYNNHLMKDHSKLDLSSCILGFLNLITPNYGVKSTPSIPELHSIPSMKKDHANLNKDFTAPKLVQLDGILNSGDVCSDVNHLSRSGTQCRSFSNQSTLQSENVSQLGGEGIKSYSSGSCQESSGRTCFENSPETSPRNLNESYFNEQTLFFNQLGLVKYEASSDFNYSPNQFFVDLNASGNVEARQKRLYDQLESYNFRIPIKYFAENPVKEENYAFELSKPQLLETTPESKLLKASDSNAVPTAEYTQSMSLKSFTPSPDSCLEGETPKGQHIKRSSSSELLSLVTLENNVNQYNGIYSDMSTTIDISSQSNNILVSQTSTHSVKSSNCSEKHKFSVNGAINVDSSLSKQTGLSESLSSSQNHLRENPKSVNNAENVVTAVDKNHFSTCNSAYNKCPVVRTDSKIKSCGRKRRQDTLTAVKSNLGAVKKTKVKTLKVASVGIETERVDFEQSTCITCKNSSEIVSTLDRNGNQTADKCIETNTNLEIVPNFVKSLVKNDATNLREKIGLSNFNVKENLNLNGTVVCKNRKNLTQNVNLTQENVPGITKISKVPQGDKILQINRDNKFVQLSTNSLKKICQRDEAIRSNEVSQASKSGDSFRNNCNLNSSDVQTCTVSDFCSKSGIQLENNFSREVLGAETNSEYHNITPKTPAVSLLVNSNGVIWNVCNIIQTGFQFPIVANQMFNFGVPTHTTPVNAGNSSDASKTSKAKPAKKKEAQITSKGSVKLEALNMESEKNFPAKKKRKKKCKVGDELKPIKIDDSPNGSEIAAQKKIPPLLLKDSSTEVSQASSSSSSVILDRSYCDGYNDIRSCENSDNSNMSNVSSDAVLDFNSSNGSNGLETNSELKSVCLHPMTICQQKMTVDDVSSFVSSDNREDFKEHLPACSVKFLKENTYVPSCESTCEKGSQCLESSLWRPYPFNGEIAKARNKMLRLYCCDVCGKTYSRKNHLVRHCRMHLNERPYECDTCHKNFTTSSILKQHQRLHSGERPFVCPVCEKTFTQKSSLSTHAMLHSGKPFKCYFCRFSVVSNHKLQRHLKRHYINDSGLYCCVCEYRFGLEGSFREHLTEVHGYSSVLNIELDSNSKSRRRVRKNYGGPIEEVVQS